MKFSCIPVQSFTLIALLSFTDSVSASFLAALLRQARDQFKTGYSDLYNTNKNALEIDTPLGAIRLGGERNAASRNFEQTESHSNNQNLYRPFFGRFRDLVIPSEAGFDDARLASSPGYPHRIDNFGSLMAASNINRGGIATDEGYDHRGSHNSMGQ